MAMGEEYKRIRDYSLMGLFAQIYPSDSSRESQRQPHAPDRSNDPAAQENDQPANSARHGYRGAAREKTQQANQVQARKNEPKKRPTTRERSLLEGEAARPKGTEADKEDECPLEPVRWRFDQGAGVGQCPQRFARSALTDIDHRLQEAERQEQPESSEQSRSAERGRDPLLARTGGTSRISC